MTGRELDDLKKSIDDDYHKKIAAVETLRSLLFGTKIAVSTHSPKPKKIPEIPGPASKTKGDTKQCDAIGCTTRLRSDSKKCEPCGKNLCSKHISAKGLCSECASR